MNFDLDFPGLYLFNTGRDNHHQKQASHEEQDAPIWIYRYSWKGHTNERVKDEEQQHCDKESRYQSKQNPLGSAEKVSRRLEPPFPPGWFDIVVPYPIKEIPGRMGNIRRLILLYARR